MTSFRHCVRFTSLTFILSLAAAAASASILATVTTGTYPNDIVFNAQRHRAYIITSAQGSLWVFDTDTYTMLGRLDFGRGTRSLALDAAAGRLYVANGDLTQRVYAIDEDTLSVVREYSIPNALNPTFLALDVSRQHLFVTHDIPAGTVSVLDLSTGSVLAQLVTNGGSSVGIAFDSTRDLVYATTYNHMLHAIDARTLSLAWEMDASAAGIVRFDPVSRDVYVATNNFVEGAHHVSRINPDTQTIVGTAPVPNVYGFAVGGPKHRVYAAQYWDNQMAIWNASLTTQAGTVPVCCHSEIAGVDPNSGLVWYADEFGTVYIVRDDYGNAAPSAQAATVTLDEDTSSLVVLRGSDPDGDSLSYLIVASPQHGTLSGTAPNLVYSPAQDYFGSDTFTFKVSDGQEESNVATVSITVAPVNDPPAVTAGGPYEVIVGGTITLAATGTDVDDGTLLYAWDLDGDGSFETSGRSVAFTAITAGAHSVAVRATDNGGLFAIAQTVVVADYAVCVLFDQTHAVKSGATIPIKLRLCDASGRNMSAANVAVRARSLVRVSDQVSALVMDAGSANPDSDFRYDASLAGYIFNLQTTGLATGTWRLGFTGADDPIEHGVTFQVR